MMVGIIQKKTKCGKTQQLVVSCQLIFFGVPRKKLELENFRLDFPNAKSTT